MHAWYAQTGMRLPSDRKSAAHLSTDPSPRICMTPNGRVRHASNIPFLNIRSNPSYIAAGAICGKVATGPPESHDGRTDVVSDAWVLPNVMCRVRGSWGRAGAFVVTNNIATVSRQYYCMNPLRPPSLRAAMQRDSNCGSLLDRKGWPRCLFFDWMECTVTASSNT